MADLLQRVHADIATNREQVNKLIDQLQTARPMDTQQEILLIFIGWLQGIEKALDTISLDVMQLTGETQD